MVKTEEIKRFEENPEKIRKPDEIPEKKFIISNLRSKSLFAMARCRFWWKNRRFYIILWCSNRKSESLYQIFHCDVNRDLVFYISHCFLSFSFFLERNMLSFFLKIMNQKCGSYVCVQLLQTLNILFENIRNETSICKYTGSAIYFHPIKVSFFRICSYECSLQWYIIIFKEKPHLFFVIE